MFVASQKPMHFLRINLPVFNSNEKTFHDQPGINITTPFGDLEPLRCLIRDTGLLCWSASSTIAPSSTYYYSFVESLKKLYNFTESENLIGAAYDWRYPPEFFVEMQKKFFESLKREIETSVERTGLKAVIVAHSMGNKVLHYFLTRETTAQWREQYMNMTINAAPAFGGSVGAMKELATGKGIAWLGIGVRREVARDFTRSLPSLASLLPSPSLFNSSRILVSVGNKTFTTADMEEFLTLANSSHLFSHFRQSEEIQPDVPMLVVIGNLSKSTPSRYTYARSIDEEPVEENKVDGDERIEAAVIEELCRMWSKDGAQIELKHLPKEHTKLIMSHEFVNIFGNAVVRKLPDGQRYPMLQNVVLTRGNRICFSAEPYARCHSGIPPLKSLMQVAQFVCFPQESEMAKELTKQEAENMIFDLTEYKVAFSASLEVAQICIDI
ncbi:lecithin:cholesterol acyltransferase domain-containing protein [Ditylenchus destructor]|uniref:Lecithin:cholesterol acyltransferase domain-containing protein n=1 Tax=Ditylenchus destructor TaxID=166010 RepID=A0AAD4MRR6_9BILA|nr:lecithin:cholesterol acyltransferase domain-containing protein [Ditylenchus destructor]